MTTSNLHPKILDLSRRFNKVRATDPDDFLSFAEIAGSFAGFRARNPKENLGPMNQKMSENLIESLVSSLEKNAKQSVLSSFLKATNSFMRLSKITRPLPPDAKKIYAAFGLEALRFVHQIMNDPACDKRRFKPTERAIRRRLSRHGIKEL